MLISACTGSIQPTVRRTAPTIAPATSAEPAPTERAVRAQSTLAAWAVAVETHDRLSYENLLARRDSGFVTRSATLWTTLVALPLTMFTPALGARTVPLAAERQALLGPDAWVQEVTVTWRLTGDTGSATHRVWFTFVPDGDAVRLGGTTDGEDEGPQPLWWTEPVTAATVGASVALVAGDDTGSAAQARTWAARVARAAREVAARIDPARRWPARLVVEVPENQTDFERVLGVRAGSYASIAAVAWPEGPDPATVAVRIIVNPAVVRGLGDEGLAVLLTHEATHVATRSAASPAPTWLLEGYADAIAYATHPATVSTAAAIALDDVTEHGPPAALPVGPEFSPGAARLDLTYARAWLACRYVAESRSPTDLNRVYEAVDGGTTLDTALPAVLGVDEATFVSRWKDWLVAAAEDR